jgi:hypothetical protein
VGSLAERLAEALSLGNRATPAEYVAGGKGTVKLLPHLRSRLDAAL